MKSRIVQIIDVILLTVLVVFCYRYSIDGVRGFAEIHVQFSFLDFPIFIGEFLLAGCLVLFGIKWYLAPKPLNKWHYVLFLYFGFVLVKAFLGYVHWGPLAFRDAALFYYLAFAVIAYYAYRREYFTNRVFLLICYAALIVFFRVPKFNDYWYFGSLALGLIVAYCFPERWFGALIALSVVLLMPHYYLLSTCRAVILGVFISCSFLMIVSAFFWQPRYRRAALVAGVLFVLAASLYVFHFSHHASSESIFDWSGVAKEMRDVDTTIAVRKKDFKPEHLTPHLYNPNTEPSDDRESQEGAGKNDVENPAVRKAFLPGHGSAGLEGPSASVPQPAAVLSADKQNQVIESSEIGSTMFRLVIWRDAVGDLESQRPLLGFDFGRPFRSTGLEIIRTAMGEWERDGWICFHNAFLNIIYRTGVFGAAFITVLIWTLAYMIRVFIKVRSWPGLLLCATILSWMVIFGLAVLLELPYGAIPFWVLCGLTLAFAHQEEKKIPLS